jgi:hypothetical protein
VNDLLLWALSSVLFLMAVACSVFASLVRDHEHRYLSWAAWSAWAVLCLALALVMSAGLM